MVPQSPPLSLTAAWAADINPDDAGKAYSTAGSEANSAGAAFYLPFCLSFPAAGAGKAHSTAGSEATSPGAAISSFPSSYCPSVPSSPAWRPPPQVCLTACGLPKQTRSDAPVHRLGCGVWATAAGTNPDSLPQGAVATPAAGAEILGRQCREATAPAPQESYPQPTRSFRCEFVYSLILLQAETGTPTPRRKRRRPSTSHWRGAACRVAPPLLAQAHTDSFLPFVLACLA